MNTVTMYFKLKRMNLTNAWSLSGMPDLMDKAIWYLCCLTGIAMLLFLLSDYANASGNSAKQEHEAYIRALEGVVKACISDAHGKAVMVGVDWFLCGIVPMMEKP